MLIYITLILNAVVKKNHKQTICLEMNLVVNLVNVICTQNDQLTRLDVSDCISLSELICNENLLTNLDLSNFDLSKVQNYYYNMLGGCYELQTLKTPKKISRPSVILSCSC